jgi:hypothetical protein
MVVDRKNTCPLPFHGLDSGDHLYSQMKSCLVFKTDGDAPVESNANFSSNLMQPVLQLPLGGFTLREPTIQSYRTGNRKPVSQPLAPNYHAVNMAYTKNAPLTGYWQ